MFQRNPVLLSQGYFSQQTEGQNHNIKAANESFGNVAS
jgi:hypothetical protein